MNGEVIGIFGLGVRVRGGGGDAGGYQAGAAPAQPSYLQEGAAATSTYLQPQQWSGNEEIRPD